MSEYSYNWTESKKDTKEQQVTKEESKTEIKEYYTIGRIIQLAIPEKVSYSVRVQLLDILDNKYKHNMVINSESDGYKGYDSDTKDKIIAEIQKIKPILLLLNSDDVAAIKKAIENLWGKQF